MSTLVKPGARRPPSRQQHTALRPDAAPIRQLLRGDAAVLVGGRALDADDVNVRRLGHFPQTVDGEYAGPSPGDGLSAVAHLEAMRVEGYDTLVLPGAEHWWLDQHRDFKRHLLERYAELLHDDTWAVYDLRDARAEGRHPARQRSIDTVLTEVEGRLARPPNMLDWRTGAKLRQRFPHHAVAMVAADRLPHIDASIDLVFLADASPEALREATRVATAGVVLLQRGQVQDVWWLDTKAAMPHAAGDTSDRTAIELLVAEGLILLPGARAALAAALERFPQLAAVGGRVMACTGRLLHAGGALAADVVPSHIGAGDPQPGHARYSFARRVDFCSPWFMAVRAGVLADVGGIAAAPSLDPFAAADVGLRFESRGHVVAYQPEANAVCSVALTRTLARLRDPGEERRARTEFGRRWRAELQARRSRAENWAI